MAAQTTHGNINIEPAEPEDHIVNMLSDNKCSNTKNAVANNPKICDLDEPTQKQHILKTAIVKVSCPTPHITHKNYYRIRSH